MYVAKDFELVRQTLLPRSLTEKAGLSGAHPAVYWREKNWCLLRTTISCPANFDLKGSVRDSQNGICGEGYIKRQEKMVWKE